MKKIFVILLLNLLFFFGVQAQEPSGLNSSEFGRYWKVESESPDYKVMFCGDTVDIIAPKGLTMWRKEKMSGTVTIEYDARVVDRGQPIDRLSDLNCFWMASDPKYPGNLWKRSKWRNGVFVNCYSLQLYYMGYGGNHNSTTRFRRYNGDEAGVTDKEKRPTVLQEYTDPAHLLEANHWYHIKITNAGGRIKYYIDGCLLVDFNDPEPLTSGWFGFRTTLSHTQVTNFRYQCVQEERGPVMLHWIGNTPQADKSVSFGVPFKEGEMMPGQALLLETGDRTIPTDRWPLAYWPDGSVKWLGMAGVIPGGTARVALVKPGKGKRHNRSAGYKEQHEVQRDFKKGASSKDIDKDQRSNGLQIVQTSREIKINTGVVTAYIPRQGNYLLDSLVYKGVKVGGRASLLCTTQSQPISESTLQVTFQHYISEVEKVTVERAGNVRAVVKIEGVHCDEGGRKWLPFVVRVYFYNGNEQIKMVHSFVYDGDQNKDFIHSLGIRFEVPMRDELYNRHIAFSCDGNGVWSEPVQPLVGRRLLMLKSDSISADKTVNKYPWKPFLQQLQMEGKRIPPYKDFDMANRDLLDHWAAWNGYRLSQLSDNSYAVRKCANNTNPWIGTYTGQHADGYAFAGDVSGGLGVYLRDFWQSYPSSLEVNDARSKTALLTVWLWSPESEPMDLRHYDNVAHGLNESYEDVQKGMSTPYGIARTSELTLVPQSSYPGKAGIAAQAKDLSVPGQLVCYPEYLHSRHAFGIWSLPDRSTFLRGQVEDRLDSLVAYYQKAIKQHKWYGFWNYGDVMHTYDPVRHEWRYDIGGYAWDNTELASNLFFWYNFLRSGSPDLWRIARTITRHTGEVDVYHLGPNSGLGSRHNVSHWGCGAKEARISQAEWNRFYYYLTTDERCGDLMDEVKDADQKLYHLDPMRLAEPRLQYPCNAPARLRIGPDWLAYAGNWMTEWERTRSTAYRDKIIAGMKSIARLPHGLFTGNKALGYDPATGVLSYDGAPNLQNTNHLMTIMGGFEIMNEMMDMIHLPEWEAVWLDHAKRYKGQAWKLSRSNFRVSRLMGYAAWKLRRSDLAKEAWDDLLSDGARGGKFIPFKSKVILPPEVPAAIDENPWVSTNGTATWGLDAIYLLEVCPPMK